MRKLVLTYDAEENQEALLKGFAVLDQEAMKKRKIEEERQELLHMKKDIDALIHDGNTEWIKVSTPNHSGEFRRGWYENYFLEKKKEFEEKYGEPLFLENELN